MRIHVSSAGLAAFLTILAGAKGDDYTAPAVIPDNQYIQFTYTDTNWNSTRTFENDYVLKWTKDTTIQIQNASLWKYDLTTEERYIIFNQTSEQTWTKGGPGGHTTQRRSSAGDVGFTADFGTKDPAAGSITLNTSSTGSDSNLNAPLYLQLYWQKDMTQGYSYSRYFAMSGGEGAADDDTSSFLSEKASTTAAYGECPGTACPTGQSSPFSTSSSQTASSSTSTASSGASQAAASSSSSGLSTGAIAGIAVACGIVGLALISAAIWFLCCFNRRQRRNGTGHSALAQHHQQNGSYVSDGMARGMRSDKELPHVTDSPQSAFAPNRGLRDSMSSTAMGMGIGAGAGAGAAAGLMTPVGSGNEHQQQQQQQQQQPMNVHQHSSVVMSDDGDESTYTPYRDHTPPPTNLYAQHHDAASTNSQTSLPSSLPPHGGARSPTPPISSRYAHLVEEGMTDEEIRRLEEEERALDVAIEDAGRSSRAQSYTQGRASGGGGR